MRNILMLMLIAALATVCGCASRSGRLTTGSSYLGDAYPANAINTVAEYLAETLTAAYPPGYTTFFLQPSASLQDELAPAIDAALRVRGFTLASEQNDQAVTVVYVLDRIDEETWYSRLSVSDGLVITRTWHLTGDDLEMEAATVRRGQTESGHAQQ